MFGNGGVGALGKDVNGVMPGRSQYCNGDAGAEPVLSQQVSGSVVKDGFDTAGVGVGGDLISLCAVGVGDSKGEINLGPASINLGQVSIAVGFGGAGGVGMGAGGVGMSVDGVGMDAGGVSMGAGVAGPAVGGGT
ncbi:hypothetical protein AGMMS49593_09870 [Endomicrobiia bacterium]|nr:hypothetical protein AGMMS49593_09870 [Endomicrobiia bacterium]